MPEQFIDKVKAVARRRALLQERTMAIARAARRAASRSDEARESMESLFLATPQDQAESSVRVAVEAASIKADLETLVAACGELLSDWQGTPGDELRALAAEADTGGGS